MRRAPCDLHRRFAQTKIRPGPEKLDQGSSMQPQYRRAGQSLHLPRGGPHHLRMQESGEVIPSPFARMDFNRVQPVGHGTEQQALRTQQTRHLTDTELADLSIDDILQDRGALAEVERTASKGLRLPRGDNVKLAAIGDTVKTGAFPRHGHFAGIESRTNAGDTGVHQSKSDGRPYGTAARINNPAH